MHKPNLGSINGMHPMDFINRPAGPALFTEFLPEAAQPHVRAFREQSLQKNAAQSHGTYA